MSEKNNVIMPEGEFQKQMGGWDGTPHREPDYRIEAYWIDPYWYIATTDGIHRVVSQDQIITDEDLIWCAGEHIRILRLPQHRKE